MPSFAYPPIDAEKIAAFNLNCLQAETLRQQLYRWFYIFDHLDTWMRQQQVVLASRDMSAQELDSFLEDVANSTQRQQVAHELCQDAHWSTEQQASYEQRGLRERWQQQGERYAALSSPLLWRLVTEVINPMAIFIQQAQDEIAPLDPHGYDIYLNDCFQYFVELQRQVQQLRSQIAMGLLQRLHLSYRHLDLQHDDVLRDMLVQRDAVGIAVVPASPEHAPIAEQKSLTPQLFKQFFQYVSLHVPQANLGLLRRSFWYPGRIISFSNGDLVARPSMFALTAFPLRSPMFPRLCRGAHTRFQFFRDGYRQVALGVAVRRVVTMDEVSTEEELPTSNLPSASVADDIARLKEIQHASRLLLTEYARTHTAFKRLWWLFHRFTRRLLQQWSAHLQQQANQVWQKYQQVVLSLQGRVDLVGILLCTPHRVQEVASVVQLPRTPAVDGFNALFSAIQQRGVIVQWQRALIGQLLEQLHSLVAQATALQQVRVSQLDAIFAQKTMSALVHHWRGLLGDEIYHRLQQLWLILSGRQHSNAQQVQAEFEALILQAPTEAVAALGNAARLTRQWQYHAAYRQGLASNAALASWSDTGIGLAVEDAMPSVQRAFAELKQLLQPTTAVAEAQDAWTLAGRMPMTLNEADIRQHMAVIQTQGLPYVQARLALYQALVAFIERYDGEDTRADLLVLALAEDEMILAYACRKRQRLQEIAAYEAWLRTSFAQQVLARSPRWRATLYAELESLWIAQLKASCVAPDSSETQIRELHARITAHYEAGQDFPSHPQQQERWQHWVDQLCESGPWSPIRQAMLGSFTSRGEQQQFLRLGLKTILLASPGSELRLHLAALRVHLRLDRQPLLLTLGHDLSARQQVKALLYAVLTQGNKSTVPDVEQYNFVQSLLRNNEFAALYGDDSLVPLYKRYCKRQDWLLSMHTRMEFLREVTWVDDPGSLAHAISGMVDALLGQSAYKPEPSVLEHYLTELCQHLQQTVLQVVRDRLHAAELCTLLAQLQTDVLAPLAVDAYPPLRHVVSQLQWVCQYKAYLSTGGVWLYHQLTMYQADQRVGLACLNQFAVVLLGQDLVPEVFKPRLTALIQSLVRRVQHKKDKRVLAAALRILQTEGNKDETDMEVLLKHASTVGDNCSLDLEDDRDESEVKAVAGSPSSPELVSSYGRCLTQMQYQKAPSDEDKSDKSSVCSGATSASRTSRSSQHNQRQRLLKRTDSAFKLWLKGMRSTASTEEELGTMFTGLHTLQQVASQSSSRLNPRIRQLQQTMTDSYTTLRGLDLSDDSVMGRNIGLFLRCYETYMHKLAAAPGSEPSSADESTPILNLS